MNDVTIKAGMEATDVISAAKDMQKQLEAIFKEVSGTNDEAKIGNLKTAYEEISRTLEELNKQQSEVNLTPEYEKVIEKLHATEVSITRIKDRIATAQKSLANIQLDRALVDDNGFRGAYKKVREEIENLTKSYQTFYQTSLTIQKQLQYQQSQLEALREAAKSTGDPALWQQYGQVAEYVKQLKDEYKTLETAMQTTEQRAEQLAEAMQAVYTSTNRNYTARDMDRIKSVNNTIRELTKQIGTLEEKLTDLQNKQAEMKASGKDVVDPESTKEYKENINDLEQMVSSTSVKIRQLNESPPELGGWKVLIDTINQGPKAIIALADSIVRYLPPAVQVAYAAIKKLISLSFQFAKELTDAFKKVATKAINVANVALKALLKTLTKIASATILKPIQKIGDAVASIGKKAQSSTPSLKQLGRMFLQYGIGARSLYRLINKLRTALFEGFGTLAVAYEPFNAAMSRIVTSLEYLKNSFAAAFAPIIQYVAPALSIFIDKMASAVQMIGQFIAALTGQEFVMALPVYKDYADSSKAGAAANKELANSEKQAKKMAEDEAKAQKKREKALKDVQRTIAGFDDVEILKENTNDSDDSDTSIDPSDYNLDTPTLEKAMQTFTAMPIKAAALEFSEWLKKMWNDANFYDLGKLLSQKLGDILKAFNENVPEIEKFVRRVASSIATFLAGFLSVNETFIQLGKALGNIINLIFAFLQEFLVKFEKYDGFKNLGKDIFLTIYNALATIKWDVIFDVFARLGRGIAVTLNEVLAKPAFWQQIFLTLCNSIKAVLLMFYNFVLNLHWDEIGTAFGEGINTAIANYPLELLAKTAARFVNGIFTAIGNAARKIQWAQLGKNIADSIMLFFRRVHWRENGENFGSFVQGIFNSLKTFVDNMHFDEIAQDIVNFIQGFFSKFRWEQNLGTIVNFLNGLLDGLRTVLEPINWGDVGQKVIDAIVFFFDNFHWEEAIDTFFDLIEGLVEMLFTIVDDSRVQEIGGEIISKIKEKLESPEWQETTSRLWGLFMYWLEFKVAQLVAKDGPLWVVAGAVLEGLVKGFIENMPFSAPWFQKHLIEPFMSGINESFGITDEASGATKTKPIGASIILGLINGLLEHIPFTPQWFEANLFSPFKTGVDGAFDIQNGQSNKLLDVGKGIIKGITNGIESESPSLNTEASNINVNTESELTKGDWNASGGGIVSDFGSGMAQLAGRVQSVARDIQSHTTGTLAEGDYKLIGSTNLSNYNTGVSSFRSNIQGSIRTISTDVQSGLGEGDYNGIGSGISKEYDSGIDSNGDLAKGTAQSIADGIADAFASVDGSNIGSNILNGIYNGMVSGWRWLCDTAWNLATDLFNSACNALGIASPSKVFADKVGAMIPAGIGIGITANEDLATDTIDDMANSLVKRAGNIKIPPIAMGNVIPYNTNIQEDTNTTMKTLLDVIQSLEDSTVKRDELEEILTNVIRSNMNISFYIGDEKLARHANRGNSLIDRRYNAVSTT